MHETNTWLEQIHAVPLIGIRCHPGFVTSEHEFLQSVRPVLERFPDDEKYTIESMAFGQYRARCGDFVFGLTGTDATAEFAYSGRVVDGKNAFPELRMNTAPKPFSALLTELEERRIKFMETLPLLRERGLLRIGIVATAKIEAGNPPPGVASFLAFLGTPWHKTPEECQLQLTVEMAKNEAFSDRCHHSVSFGSQVKRPDTDIKDNSIINIRLDWQRYYSKAEKTPQATLTEHVTAVTASALSYFQTFGMGDLNYATG